jgi:hypothetical protein
VILHCRASDLASQLESRDLEFDGHRQSSVVAANNAGQANAAMEVR